MSNEKSNSYTSRQLPEPAYRVLREGATEPPFSSPLISESRTGRYYCKGCGALLFDSHQKFGSGCGWPAFDAAVSGAIEYREDTTHGMVRTEIRCAQCAGHLGHVFPDGPTATGQRYCVNGVALDFNQDE